MNDTTLAIKKAPASRHSKSKSLRQPARSLLFATAIGFAASSATAQTMTGDSLLNLLEKKGLISDAEAKEVRQEASQSFATNFQSSFRAQTGLPDWVNTLRFNGDFRGRFEENNAANSQYISRDRFRYRVRFGVTAALQDNFEVGLRLSSGNPQTNPGGTLVGGQSITANTDMNSLESRKFIWIDEAYAKWTPIQNSTWTVSGTFGKMENPFQLSNMVWDYDIDPEGGAVQIAYHVNDQQTIKANGAFFVLDEINQAQTAAGLTGVDPNNDPYVYGGQLTWESKWNSKVESSLGLAMFDIAHKDSLSAKLQPFYNSGNTRDVNGFLKYDMNPVITTASLTYKFDSCPLYPGKFPLKACFENMYNPGAPVNNEAYRVGLTLGKAGRKGAWEIAYRYQRLEADSWFDALVDDDNGAFYATGNPQLAGTGKANGWFGGTNVKGHLVQATYSFTDFCNFTFTYYMNDLIINAPGQTSSAGHFMADVMWKF